MRHCTECGAAMREGYVIDDGAEYYCTDGCLRINYTPEEWAEMYEGEVGYWTTWPEDELDAPQILPEDYPLPPTRQLNPTELAVLRGMLP